MTDATPEHPTPDSGPVSAHRPINWERFGERVGEFGMVGAALGRGVLFGGGDREGADALLPAMQFAGILGAVLGGLVGAFIGFLDGWSRAILSGVLGVIAGGVGLALAGLAFGLVAWGAIWVIGTWQVGVANWIVACVAGGLFGVVCGLVYLAVTGLPRRSQ